MDVHLHSESCLCKNIICVIFYTCRKEAIDMLNDLAVRKKMSMSSSGVNPGSDPKHSLPGSVVGRTGLRGHRTLNQDVNGPATLPRRRLAHAGVTPSPEVLSAALSREYYIPI